MYVNFLNAIASSACRHASLISPISRYCWLLIKPYSLFSSNLKPHSYIVIATMKFNKLHIGTGELRVLFQFAFSSEGILEPQIRCVDIGLQFSSLVLAQLLCRFHLIQSDQPLNDLASIFEIPVRHLVDALDNVGQQWMELVFCKKAQS